MSKFSDYLASEITPQMTLLEKFNALLKFLKEHDYECSISYDIDNAVDISSLVLNGTQQDITESVMKIYKKLLDTRCVINAGTLCFITYMEVDNLYPKFMYGCIGDNIGMRIEIEFDFEHDKYYGEVTEI